MLDCVLGPLFGRFSAKTGQMKQLVTPRPSAVETWGCGNFSQPPNSAVAPPPALLSDAQHSAVKFGHTAAMRVISALLLAQLGGNANPGPADVKKILSSVGVEAPEENITRLFKELEGKDVKELIAAGREKLQAIPSGGGGGGGAAPAAGGGGGAAPAKEEKKDEPSEADEDMGFSLFD